MVAQHRRQFPDRLAAIGGDIAHHAFITATIIADVDACDTMLPQDRQERALAARFDTPDGGGMLCDLGLDTSLNGGLVGGKLRRYHTGVSSSERFAARSEEHTSELQSLMRISYAVFCLK